MRRLPVLVTSLWKAKKETYLLLNKSPSYCFEKLNWKSRLNYYEIVTKSIWEFLKLVS